MALDSISETISHFIGIFDVTIEKARLRDQYEEFTAERKKAELEELKDPGKINIKSDLDPDPGKFKAVKYNFGEEAPADAPPSDLPVIDEGVVAGAAFTSAIDGAGPAYFATGAIPMMLLLPAPAGAIWFQGSAVTYTIQKLTMVDNDTLGIGDFRDADLLMAKAEAALTLAKSLHFMSVPDIDIEYFMSLDDMDALAEAMNESFSTDVEGVVVYSFQGEDAIGTIVNGEHVDELPVWKDLLPAHHQPEEEEEEPEWSIDKDLPDEWDQSKDQEFEDGHTVITGGNMVINETNIQIGWVDAPYIAVGGSAISLTLVSQVAVASDIDLGAPGGKGSGTSVFQTVHIETEANAASWLPEESAEATQPAFLTIDWIEGDMIVANFVKQIIDATDIDNVQMEISASSTYFALGDNQLVNLNNVQEFGNYYDLILIGENMISLDMLFQTIVLMDDDVMSGGAALTAASDSEGGGSGDGNLLMNLASLTTQGEDTHEDPSDVLAGVLSVEDMSHDALEDALLSDPLFAGLEQMRILKIDGSLLQVNIIEQVAKLTDQDDVHLLGPSANGTDVIAGSNAMLNAANITKVGIDSTVMAGSEGYSDLLIHQASLIDTPENEDSGELLNEAIAFLMEDGEGAQTGMELQDLQSDDLESSMASDGMQTMLA